MSDKSAPKVFISYSWDSEDHKSWVRALATQLRSDGIDVTLDQWHVTLGDQLPAFMERAIRENDFVLIVCTPSYKQKSEQRVGGVGYEGDIIQGEVFVRGDHRKFIPILCAGKWEDAAPSQIAGKAYLPLSDPKAYRMNYPILLETLHGLKSKAPAIGQYKGIPSGALRWREIGTFKGHTHSPDIRFIAVSEDGSRAVSMSTGFWALPKDKTFSLWDVTTLREVARCTLKMREDRRQRMVDCIAMSADGTRVIASGDGAQVFYLDKDPIIRRTLLEDPIPDRPGMYFTGRTLYAWISTDNLIGIGFDGTEFHWWNLNTGMQIKKHVLQRGASSPVITKDGRVALYAIDSEIMVLDLDSNQIVNTLRGHLKKVNSIATSGDGRIAISGSNDRTIKIWDIESGSEMRTLADVDKQVNLVASSGDGSIAVSNYGFNNHIVKVHDTRADRSWTLSTDCAVWSLAMTPDANIILTGTSESKVKVWVREG